MNHITFASLFALALFLYLSVSLTALHHLLLLPAGVYFFIRHLREKGGRIFMSSDHLFLGLIIFVSTASLLVNAESTPSLPKALLKLKYFLIPFLGVYAIRYLGTKDFFTSPKVRLLFQVFLITATVATVSGLIAYFTGINPLKFKATQTSRASGLYGQVMSYAYSISIFLSGFLAYLIALKTRMRPEGRPLFPILILIVLFFINLVSLYLSYTRGALLGFILSLPFLFYFLNRRYFWISLGFGGIFLGIIATILLTGADVSVYRLNALHSNNDRLTLYSTVSNMILEKPILGVGFRNVESLCGHYRNPETPNSFCGHAHNSFLEFFAGTGIVGGVIYVLFLVFWFKRIASTQTMANLIILPMLVNFLVSGLFQSTIIDGEVAFFLMGIYLVSHLFQPQTA